MDFSHQIVEAKTHETIYIYIYIYKIVCKIVNQKFVTKSIPLSYKI